MKKHYDFEIRKESLSSQAEEATQTFKTPGARQATRVGECAMSTLTGSPLMYSREVAMLRGVRAIHCHPRASWVAELVAMLKSYATAAGFGKEQVNNGRSGA